MPKKEENEKKKRKNPSGKTNQPPSLSFPKF